MRPLLFHHLIDFLLLKEFAWEKERERCVRTLLVKGNKSWCDIPLDIMLLIWRSFKRIGLL